MEYFYGVSWKDMISEGLKWADLMGINSNATETDLLTWKQNWSIDEEEPFDLKLVFAEIDGKVVGGFRYRKDAIDSETIFKLSERLADVLFDVEDSGKKITISKLISKFHNTRLTSAKMASNKGLNR